MGLRLDRRSASFAGWNARCVCAREREREKGRLQYVDLVGPDRSWRGPPSINQRRSRYVTALVARWKIPALPARDRERRQTRVPAIVDLADGGRRFVCLYGSAEGRSRSSLVAGRQVDRLYERHQRGRFGQAGKEKT